MAETVNKKEAVRRAMAHLGDDTKAAVLRDWIKQQFAIDMTADHVSTARGEIRRERPGQPKSGAKKPAAKAKPGPQKPAARGTAAKAEPAPTAPAGPRPAVGGKKEAAIPLDDILTMRGLVDRHGAGPLHTLIDALAK
jgi:hypothetical protein